ncbi:MAG: TorD/DmsD family molecular chaperone [Burkholderiales bacterium]
MSGAAIPVDLRPHVAPEDQARAEFYALLARLWYAAPDKALLAAIAAGADIPAEGEQTGLGEAWRRLRAAAAGTDPETVRAEYDAVFVGTGKAEVTLYVSAYLVENARERVLVELREALGELGLARSDAVHEPEDHFAALLETMRHLAASGSSDDALQQQRKFFTRYMNRAYNPLTNEVVASARTDFYKHVARFTKAFCEIEAASLDML